jgi:hypothetical protein
MPDVIELTDGYRNIVQGNPLIFPNVLTCMAFVAYTGATLIGVHFTQKDQSAARVNGAWQRVQAIAPGPHRVYVAGPNWNANLLANLIPAPASFNGKVIPSGSDVQATIAAGAVALSYRKTGSGAPWTPLP